MKKEEIKKEGERRSRSLAALRNAPLGRTATAPHPGGFVPASCLLPYRSSSLRLPKQSACRSPIKTANRADSTPAHLPIRLPTIRCSFHPSGCSVGSEPCSSRVSRPRRILPHSQPRPFRPYAHSSWLDRKNAGTRTLRHFLRISLSLTQYHHYTTRSALPRLLIPKTPQTYGNFSRVRPCVHLGVKVCIFIHYLCILIHHHPVTRRISIALFFQAMLFSLVHIISFGLHNFPFGFSVMTGAMGPKNGPGRVPRGYPDSTIRRVGSPGGRIELLVDFSPFFADQQPKIELLVDRIIQNVCYV